jgi:putative endonuclease
LLVEEGRLEIVARNVVAGGVELDIVARDPLASPPLYIFVEVRSRSDARLGHPLETIGPGKRKRLIRGASAWLVAKSLWERVAVRFDVVAITKDYTEARSRTTALEAEEFLWLPGAFEAHT